MPKTRTNTGAWIVSPIYDLLFFIGTPLLCVAIALPIGRAWSSLDFYIAVMAFSSLGHHLPGFLRAYGDADLFARHRARFLLAPPLVLAAFLWFGLAHMSGLLFLLMIWSIWHVMMQHYGFQRIYEAKVGSSDPLVARLDFWLTLSWFASIVLWSPSYLHNILASAYESRLPIVPAALVSWTQVMVWSATGILTVAYAALIAVRVRQGRPPSWLKVALNVVTLAFLGLLWVGIDDIYLGLATWEIFHDVQYFALTWIYNRRLVDKGLGDTRFMRYLFRRRLPMLLLYVGAIAAYGAVGYAATTQTHGQLNTVLTAFLLTSTFLHYYFDGFIWKVRQPRTRQGLDLDDATAAADPAHRPLAPRVAHAVGLILPIAVLAGFGVAAAAHDPVEMRAAIVAAAPDATESHYNYGLALDQGGRRDDAAAAYREALRLRPDHAPSLAGLGLTLLADDAEPAATAQLLEQAVAADPRDATARANLAVVRLAERRMKEAIALHREARALDPDAPIEGPDQLLLEGFSLVESGDAKAAVPFLSGALDARPGDVDALDALWYAAAAVGDVALQERALTELHEAAPDRRDVSRRLVDLLLHQQRDREAIGTLRRMVEQDERDDGSRLRLAEVLATHPDPSLRDGPAACAHADVVLRQSRESTPTLSVLAAALAEVGDFDAAVSRAEQALLLTDDPGVRTRLNAQIELYRQRRPYRAIR